MKRALFVVGAMAAILVGCADESGPGLRRGTNDSNVTGTQAPTTEPAAANPADSACSAVPAATKLSEFTDVSSAFIVGSAVFFQSGTKVLRVGKDGKGTKKIIKSPNLVSLYADENALVLIETTGNSPEATIRVINAVAPQLPEGAEEGATPPEPAFPEFGELVTDDGVLGGLTTATNFKAGSVRVFASDETSFYLQAEDNNGNVTIQKVTKANPGARSAIVTLADSTISNPQLASSAVWYVRDSNRVYKVALADEENGLAQGEPLEVFGIQYATCNLAVGESAAFCSVGTAVERRDLTGGNPATILDATRSKLAARFGKATNYKGSLFVQSDEPDPAVKYVIRTVTPSATGAEETLAACGRNLVTSLSVDGTHIAWTEKDTGIFIAPR